MYTHFTCNLLVKHQQLILLFLSSGRRRRKLQHATLVLMQQGLVTPHEMCSKWQLYSLYRIPGLPFQQEKGSSLHCIPGLSHFNKRREVCYTVYQDCSISTREGKFAIWHTRTVPFQQEKEVRYTAYQDCSISTREGKFATLHTRTVPFQQEKGSSLYGIPGLSHFNKRREVRYTAYQDCPISTKEGKFAIRHTRTVPFEQEKARSISSMLYLLTMAYHNQLLPSNEAPPFQQQKRRSAGTQLSSTFTIYFHLVTGLIHFKKG